jgi:hypothetical protein
MPPLTQTHDPFYAMQKQRSDFHCIASLSQSLASCTGLATWPKQYLLAPRSTSRTAILFLGTLDEIDEISPPALISDILQLRSYRRCRSRRRWRAKDGLGQ